MIWTLLSRYLAPLTLAGAISAYLYPPAFLIFKDYFLWLFAATMLFAAEDKLIHALAYALMGLLAWMTFSHQQRTLAIVFCMSVVFCSLYGLSDEWHQSFVPGREASFGDWLADTLGATLVAILLFRLSNHHATKRDRR